MVGRRRGARSGRGWDAAPPRPRTRRSRPAPEGESQTDPSAEFAWPEGAEPLDDPWGGRAAVLDHDGPSPDPDPAPDSVASRARLDGADGAELAREICLRQLAVRPRTRAELARALARRGISAETA